MAGCSVVCISYLKHSVWSLTYFLSVSVKHFQFVHFYDVQEIYKQLLLSLSALQ